MCLGGQALAAICRAKCSDFSYFSGGAPDLLMIRVRFVDDSGDENHPLKLTDWLGDKWEQLGADRESNFVDDMTEEVKPAKWRRGRKTRSIISNGTTDNCKLESPTALAEVNDQTVNILEVHDEEKSILDNISSSHLKHGEFICNETDLELLLPPDGHSGNWIYESMLVEVKGPTDSLAYKQLLWLEVLQNGGVNALVCHVYEPDTLIEMQEKNTRATTVENKRKMKRPYVRLS